MKEGGEEFEERSLWSCSTVAGREVSRCTEISERGRLGLYECER